MISGAVISQDSCSVEQVDSPVSICHLLWRSTGNSDVWNYIPLLPWVSGTENSGLLSGSRGGTSMESSSPAPLCPSLTGSFYTYSLKVSHLTSFPFTVACYMKQTARPTPSAQPFVPEKAFIHSPRQDRQTYSL